MSSTNVEAARTKLMEEMKVDILTELQEADNEKARREVSRSFICTFLRCISMSESFIIPLADTITGQLLPGS